MAFECVATLQHRNKLWIVPSVGKILQEMRTAWKPCTELCFSSEQHCDSLKHLFAETKRKSDGGRSEKDTMDRLRWDKAERRQVGFGCHRQSSLETKLMWLAGCNKP